MSTVILKTSPFANFRGIGRNYGPFWVDRPGISCRETLGGNLEAGCNNKPSLPFGDYILGRGGVGACDADTKVISKVN